MDFFSKNQSFHLGIFIWISLLTLMVFFIIIIGGLTRLTDSGLSMVDWKPIIGSLPPLNNQSWINIFDQYKLTPQFKIVNSSMTLNEFKFIFWWEWGHRFFARCIGLVFFLPLIYFLFKKKLSKYLIFILIFVFIFGLFQALVGWWMVKSGLVNNPYVSAYRLAFHLINALIIFSILFWLSLSIYFGIKKRYFKHQCILYLFLISLFLIFITIISGAFMAGTDAGNSFNTFPLMNEKFIPEGYFINEYGWKNIFENTIAINFNHRWIAIFSFFYIFFLIFYLLIFKKDEIYNKSSLLIILVLLFLQILLGILTLIYEVPIKLASLHQANAVLLLASLLFAYHRLIYK